MLPSAKAPDRYRRVAVERYARYVNAILARAYRLEPHVAEDTFQDVFERVYEQLPKLREPWLAQLTRRLAIDALRTGARDRPAPSFELVEDVDADDDRGIARGGLGAPPYRRGAARAAADGLRGPSSSARSVAATAGGSCRVPRRATT